MQANVETPSVELTQELLERFAANMQALVRPTPNDTFIYKTAGGEFKGLTGPSEHLLHAVPDAQGLSKKQWRTVVEWAFSDVERNKSVSHELVVLDPGHEKTEAIRIKPKRRDPKVSGIPSLTA